MNTIHTLDKTFSHHSYYFTEPIAIWINNYEITIYSEEFGIDESFDFLFDTNYERLAYLLKSRVDKYCIGETAPQYKEGQKVINKKGETILVYTNDLPFLYTLFSRFNQIEDCLIKTDISENQNMMYISLFKHDTKDTRYGIELRSLETFLGGNERTALTELYGEASAYSLYKFSKHLINEVFVPYKKVFLTVNQKLRRDLYYLGGNTDELHESAPNWNDYDGFFKQAKRGGVCFMKYRNKQYRNLIMGDITSCYPYILLCNKFPMTKMIQVNPDSWIDLLQDDTKCFIGEFFIEFDLTNKSYLSRIYDDVLSKAKVGNIVCTNFDIKALSKIIKIHKIKCIKLYSAELDYLPEYLTSYVVSKYFAKKFAKKDTAERTIAKLELNSITGNLQLNIRDEHHYNHHGFSSNPIWGIFITAYARFDLILLALSLDNSVYGDTDSVFCNNTDENKKVFDDFNKKRKETVKSICENRNYDFFTLNGLGEIEYEEVIDFLAKERKLYTYIKNGVEIVKSSGYTKGLITHDILFNQEVLPTKRTKKVFLDDNNNISISYIDTAIDAIAKTIAKSY